MARNPMSAVAQPDDTVRPLIRSLRGQRVILDSDLAALRDVYRKLLPLLEPPPDPLKPKIGFHSGNR